MRPLILAGLAGALSRSVLEGKAWIIDEVRDAGGTLVGRPTWPQQREPGASRAVITSSEVTLTTPSAKLAMGARSGAGLVDLESIAFAAAAQSAGIDWAIVRGVSDGVDISLPHDVDRWVDERGRTRGLYVLRRLVQRPTLLREVLDMRRRGLLAITQAAAALDVLMAQGRT